MADPLVSIIIPTYNRDTYLEKAISSVCDQSYKEIEILVVDDGSETNYAEKICKKYHNCYYHYKDNGGLSSARNFGIERSKGKYIAFLDDDDFWKPNKLERQIALLETNDEIDLVHSAAVVVDKDSTPTGKIIGASAGKEKKRSGYVFWNALGVWVVKSPTPLFRRSVFDDGLKFDENIKVGEDVDFYQRFFYDHQIAYISEPLAYYRDNSDSDRLSVQRKRYLGLEWRMYQNFRDMGVKNPFILYRIARRLLRRAQQRELEIFPNQKVRTGSILNLVNPAKVLQNMVKRKGYRND